MDTMSESPTQQGNQVIANSLAPQKIKERPLRTLPRGLRFSAWVEGDSEPTMKKGIFASREFEAGVWFGPYEGAVVLPSVVRIKSDEMWEVHCHGKLCHYLDGGNEESANWMRNVRFSKEPAPCVNLLAYQHQGCIYYHSFTAISPGQELMVCLKHFKWEDDLNGPRDQAHICSVCQYMHINQTIPAVRYLRKGSSKKTSHRTKVGLSPDTMATKRLALNSEIDKLRQKLGKGTAEDASTSDRQALSFGGDHSTFMGSSLSGLGVSDDVEQQKDDHGLFLQEQPVPSWGGQATFQENSSEQLHNTATLPPATYDSDKLTALHPSTSLANFLLTSSGLGSIPSKFSEYTDASVKRQAIFPNTLNDVTGLPTARGKDDAKPYSGKLILESSMLREKCRAKVKRVQRLLPNRQFFCIYCGWRFKDLYHFMRHKKSHLKQYRWVKHKDIDKQRSSNVDKIQVVTNEAGVEMYACSVCGRTFKEIHTMKTHERSHANHTCHYCGKVFSSSTVRIVHERTHTGERPYQCDQCPKGFRTSYMRTRHKQQCHNTERPYKCKYCDKTFKVRSAVTTHMKTHTHERNLPCPACGKTFGLPRDLLRHMKTHTDERPFQCEYCQKTYKQKSTLTTHVQKHFVGDFACKYCPLKFRTVQAHGRHESVHTGIKPVFKRIEKPFPCRYCDRVFPRNVKRKVHERVHTGELPFQCELCEKAYSSKKGLESHMRTHSDERPYPCLVCGKSFKERNTLKCHMRIHTGDRPFKCEQCDKTFRVSDALKKHRRSHSDERAYKCQQCEKAFKQLSALRKHERWHLGLRPHICEVCGRDFVDRYRLRIHQSIHLEVRPHKCNMCDKSFTEACRLKRHLREHENLREFACEICNKKYNFKDQLETHLKTHSDERPVQCPNCPKCFKSTSAMHRHQRVHSNQSFTCPVCNKDFKFVRSLKKHALQHFDKDMLSLAKSTSLADFCGIIPPDSEANTGNESSISSDQMTSRSLVSVPFVNHQDAESSPPTADFTTYPKSLGVYREEPQDTESDQSTIIDDDEPTTETTGVVHVRPKHLFPITPLNEIKTSRSSKDK